MNPWLLISLIGLGTVLLRGSFLAMAGEGAMPAGFARALRFVPASVLTAITVPSVLYPHGAYALTPGNARIYAALVAGFIAYRYRNLSFTVLAGLGTLWIVERILG